jgi:glycerol uptake facilitator-like aquaporin
MIYVFGDISGTHINPAVTISLALGKLMPKKDVLGYVFAQIVGAILASGKASNHEGDLAGGYYVRPTVLKGTNNMRVFQE